MEQAVLAGTGCREELPASGVFSTSTAGKHADTSPDPVNTQCSGRPRPTLVFPCIFTLKPVRWFPAGLGLIQHTIQWSVSDHKFGAATNEDTMWLMLPCAPAGAKSQGTRASLKALQYQTNSAPVRDFFPLLLGTCL